MDSQSTFPSEGLSYLLPPLVCQCHFFVCCVSVLVFTYQLFTRFWISTGIVAVFAVFLFILREFVYVSQKKDTLFFVFFVDKL